MMTHRAVSHSPASSFHYPNISLFLFKGYKERAGQNGARTWGKKTFQCGRNDGKMVLELRNWRISASVVREGDGSRWARDGRERSQVHACLPQALSRLPLFLWRFPTLPAVDRDPISPNTQPQTGPDLLSLSAVSNEIFSSNPFSTCLPCADPTHLYRFKQLNR